MSKAEARIHSARGEGSSAVAGESESESSAKQRGWDRRGKGRFSESS
ncbi:hypothetical protein GCWU000341_00725 [Oribacterium sp. oral taxon 078 str. F0262]|nr:hypothetical protein GCWU000341_00725 [Oribacterium sp. oral taxon 078 str. F0262]